MNKLITDMKLVMDKIELGKIKTTAVFYKTIKILGGDESSRKRHISKGKLLPRDRLSKLLDSG